MSSKLLYICDKKNPPPVSLSIKNSQPVSLSIKKTLPVSFGENKKINYVINLKRRQDRWNNFLEKIEKTNLKNETFIKIDGFDAKNYKDEIKRILKFPNNIYKKIIDLFIKKKTYFTKGGEFGCLISHIIVLDNIIRNEQINQNDYITIFEDDIDYCINFEKNYEKLQNCNLNKLNIDFLYIGGRNIKNYDYKHQLFEDTINENIYYRGHNINNNNSIHYDRCTSSYIVRKSACNKIINNIYNAIDNNFHIIAIDHIYNNCMKNIRTFEFIPHLFYSPLIFNSDVQVNTQIQF
jgi:GR25 family glycosyltransferase involved in LPS biosynthesis